MACERVLGAWTRVCWVSVAVLAVLAWGVCRAVAGAQGEFSDLADAGVHEGAVRALAGDGVLSGTGCGDGELCPGEPLERWEMAVWLARVLDGGDPVGGGGGRFGDVDAGVWWAAHVERLFELGVTFGCSSEPALYCPDDAVTRAQMASFLVRAFGLEAASAAGFEDVSGGVHAASIDALFAAGVTVGCSADPLRYCPGRATTRAQMASFLVRALSLDAGGEETEDAGGGRAGPAGGGAQGEFSDLADAGVHEGAVRALAGDGVLSGTGCGDGELCPGEPLERWEMAVWLARVLDGGDPVGGGGGRFGDVDAGVWWAAHVERLFELGVTFGCSSEPALYCPDDAVTRAQMASFLVRAFGLEAASAAGFEDVSGGVHAASIDALFAAGVTVGCSADPLRYCPGRATTRAQMASFLVRALSLDAGGEETEDAGGGRAGPPTPRRPQPSGVTAEPGLRGVVVSWSSPAAAQGLTGFAVYWQAQTGLSPEGRAASRGGVEPAGEHRARWRAVQDGFEHIQGCVQVEADETSVTLQGLVAEVGYRVSVSALYGGGCDDDDSGAVAVSGVVAPLSGGAPPGPPGALAVAADPGGRGAAAEDGAGRAAVAVSWVGPAADPETPVLFVELQWKPDDVPTYEAAGTSSRLAGGSPLVVGGFALGESYDFRLRAWNLDGAGDWSLQRREVLVAYAPDAPTAVTATGEGDRRFTLRWEAPAFDGGVPVDGYRVQWAEAGSTFDAVDAGGARTADVGAGEHERTVSGLAPGEYRLRVAAENLAGYSDAVEAAVAVGAAPSPPGGVVARGHAEGIVLSWEPPLSEVDGYELRHRRATDQAWPAETAVGDVTTHVIAGLDMGVGYDVQVRAVNAHGGSGWVQAAAVAGTAPGPPAALSVADAGGAGITVGWAPSADVGSGIDGYRVQWTDGGSLAAAASRTVGAGTTSFTIPVGVLVKGRTYQVRVVAFNAAGEGASLTHSAAATTAPGVPTDVLITPDDEQVTVSWAAPGDHGGTTITGYVLQWASSAGFAGASEDATIGAASESYQIGGLTNGTAVWARVAAANATDQGEWSAPVSTLPSVTAVRPTGVTVTALERGLRVSWIAPTHAGLTGYTLRWHTVAGQVHDHSGDQAAAASATTADISGLVAGLDYRVHVDAHHSGGVSASAAAVTAEPSPKQAPLAAPTGVEAAADPGGRLAASSNPSDPVSVIVSWAAPTAAAAAPVIFTELQWKPQGAAGYGADDRVVLTGGSPRSLAGFALGSSYDIRLRAWNLDGAGAWSAQETSLVAYGPDAPGLAVLAAGQDDGMGSGEIGASWQSPTFDGGSAVSGYELQWTDTDPSAGFTPIGSATITTTSHTIGELVDGTRHWVRVRALNPASVGAWSSTRSAVPTTVPDAPTIVAIAAGVANGLSSGELRVEWEAPTLNGGSALTRYEVQYRAVGADAWQNWPHATTATTTVITELVDGVTYQVQVAAANINGTGAWSPTESAAPVEDVPPSLVTAAVPAHGESVVLTFDEPLGSANPPGAERFSVTVGGRAAGVASVSLQGRAVVLVLDRPIAAGASVTVVYLGPSGAGAIADVVGNPAAAFTTGASGAPAVANASVLRAPGPARMLAASAGDGLLRVMWTASADNGGTAIESYDVSYAPASGVAYSAHASVVPQPGDTVDTLYSTEITGLDNGIEYTVRVVAVNAVNEGRVDGFPGAAATTAAAAGRPEAVRNLLLVPRNGELRATWDEPANAADFPDSDEAHLLYLVEWLETSKVGRGTFSTRYVRHDAGLVPGADNGYRVGFAKVRHGPFDEQTITVGVTDLGPLQNGASYTIRVSAVFAPAQAIADAHAGVLVSGDAAVDTGIPAGAVVADDSPLYGRLRTAISSVAGDLGTDYPWVSDAWGLLAATANDATLTIADLAGRISGSVEQECDPVNPATGGFDVLGTCGGSVVLSMDLDIVAGGTTSGGVPTDELKAILVHELAHVYTANSELPTPRWPWGLAWLYFWESAGSYVHPRTCPAELLAETMTALALPNAYLPYYDICFDGVASQSERAEMAAIVTSAAAGQESARFVETYRAGGTAAGEVDREQTMRDVRAVGQRHRRHLLVQLLQDAFGGYCSEEAAVRAAFKSNTKIEDPWVDGGCGPGAPTEVSAAATANPSELEVTWTGAATSGGAPITGYVVQWKSGAEEYDAARQEVLSNKPNATSATITGLVGNVVTTVRVLAVNEIGYGAASGEATATPLLSLVPRNVLVTGRDGALEVSWHAPSSHGPSQIEPWYSPVSDGELEMDHYTVQWRLDTDNWDPSREATVTDGPEAVGDTWVYEIESLDNNKSYVVRVTADDGAGNTGVSEEVTGETEASNAALKTFIEESVLTDANVEDHPWLETAYQYLIDNDVIIRVVPNRRSSSVWMRPDRTRDGLPDPFVLEFEIANNRRENVGTISHELAHVHTLPGDIPDPAPKAIVSLFMDQKYSWVVTSSGYSCSSFELTADLFALTVVPAYTPNRWNNCSRIPHTNPTEEHNALVEAASAGEVPGWFIEEFQGDAPRVWAALKSYPDWFGATSFWLTHFRDIFGGYCSVDSAVASAFRDDSVPEHAALTNPWRLGVGGCDHQDSTASGGDRQITVQWSAPSDDGTFDITGYRVQWKAGAEGWDTSRQSTDLGVTATSHTVSDLAVGTPYTVRVLAFNARGEIVSFGDLAAATDPGPPSAVRDLTATAGIGLLRAAWRGPAATGGAAIERYEVSHAPAGEEDYTAHASVVPQLGDTADTLYSTDIAGLDDGTEYTVRVVAVNSVNAGSVADFPDAAASTTATAGQPGPVGNLQVSPHNGELRVTWDAPANSAEFPDADEAHLLYLVEWLETSQVGLGTFNTRYLRPSAALVPGAANGHRVTFSRVSHGPFDPQASLSGVSSLTPLSNGSSYTVRVSALFASAQAVAGRNASEFIHGEPASVDAVPGEVVVAADSPLHARARAIVEEAYGDIGIRFRFRPELSWMSAVWGAIGGESGDTAVTVRDLPGRLVGTVEAQCDPVDIASASGLGSCGQPGELLIDVDFVTAETTSDRVGSAVFKSMMAHGMAHLHTFSSQLADPLWPWGLAWLYFLDNAGTYTHPHACPAELLADSLARLAYFGHHVPYYEACFGGALSLSVRDEMKAVVDSAARGRQSAWFVGAYREGGAADGAVDREQVWSRVREVSDTTRRHLLVLLLQDAFGGYCSEPAAIAGAFDAASDIVDPWDDGGCGPGTPGDVSAAATANAGELVVSWTAPASPGGAPITGYVVQWKSGAEEYDASRQEDVAGQPGAITTTIGGLTGGTVHTVRVLAVNSIGHGASSDEATAAPL